VELTAGHGHRDGRALHLGRPAREVAEQLGSGRHVAVAGGLDSLAVVEGLQLRQLVGVRLDQVADAPEQMGAVARGHLRPRRGRLERSTSGHDRAVDIDC
jgi:hypothetical protein